jgi:L-iditol 2-dehydrogenase
MKVDSRKNMAKMRVGVYYNNKDVRLEERAIPAIGDDELLLRVQASGICGSDVMQWYRLQNAPLVLGHEVTGEIEAVGKNVKRYKTGERVFVSHHVPCNTCRYCLRGQHTVCQTLHTTNFDPGGFSEFIRIPALNVDRGVFRLPDEVAFDEGSFIEPLGCTIRAHRLAGFQPGDTVLILGSGISGILHIALARAQGAGKVVATDVHPFRLNFAKKFGASEVLPATENVPKLIREANNGRGADIVIVCAGAPQAFSQALESVDRGGKIVFFAPTPPDYYLPLNITDIWRNGITLLPSYGAGPLDIEIAIELIANRRVPVQEMITHRLGLEQIGQGFRLVSDAKDSMKVIIHPHG